MDSEEDCDSVLNVLPLLCAASVELLAEAAVVELTGGSVLVGRFVPLSDESIARLDDAWLAAEVEAAPPAGTVVYSVRVVVPCKDEL